MYVKVTNGTVDQFPYTIGQLRRDNANTSFPKIMSSALLQSYGVYSVETGSMPTYDRKTQYVDTATTPTLVDGVWTLVRSAVSKSAAKIASDDAIEADGVRAKRDNLLTETDYLALSDNTLSAAMTTYRQALRDITSHANFPYLEKADWPTKP